MAKLKIGANTIFAGGSKAFSFIDDRIYGYTGSVSVDNNETTLFDSQTGKAYVIAKFQPVYFDTASTDDATFILKFNGVNVYTCTVAESNKGTPFQLVDLIIPPLTQVTLTGYDRTGTGPINIGGIFTGRVYA